MEFLEHLGLNSQDECAFLMLSSGVGAILYFILVVDSTRSTNVYLPV